MLVSTATEPAEGKTNRGSTGDWADPSVPAGDSPPMPRWPLIAGIVAWCLWFAFLVAMMLMRLRSEA
jgi:hypothetical protein